MNLETLSNIGSIRTAVQALNASLETAQGQPAIKGDPGDPGPTGPTGYATATGSFLDLGKVISGDIRPVLTPGAEDGLHFSLQIAAGTVVERQLPAQPTYPFNEKHRRITLAAGTFPVLDISGGQPNPLTRVIYCDATGAIGQAAEAPSGSTLLFYADGASSGSTFKFAPYLPSAFVLMGWLSDLRAKQVDMVRASLDWVRDLGGVGDGVTLNDAAAYRLMAYLRTRYEALASYSTRAYWLDITVPPGVYLFSAVHGGWNFSRCRFLGSQMEDCVFRCGAGPTEYVQASIDRAENMTFWNVQPHVTTSFPLPEECVYRNCKFVIDPDCGTVFGGTYWLNPYPNVEMVNCAFEYPRVYVPLWLYRVKNALIRGCTFTTTNGGTGASHVIRVNEPVPGGRIVIEGNRIVGPATTGIFVMSDRTYPLEGIVIRGNYVTGIREEAISLDGLGNNAGYNPCIASGTILAASNDGSGHLVITPSLEYAAGGGAGQTHMPCPISRFDFWSNFYATFEGGSGIPGAVVKILAQDSDAGTLTLNTLTPASAITVGGQFGVHGGFHGCVIEENTIENCYGTGNTYATAISLWLDAFGCIIAKNTIRDCANGIDVAGGLCFSTWRNLAYNNIIRDNVFMRCHQVATPENGTRGAVRAAYYFGTATMYGNRFRNNLVDGGQVWILAQDDAAKVWDGTNELRNGATLHAS